MPSDDSLNHLVNKRGGLACYLLLTLSAIPVCMSGFSLQTPVLRLFIIVKSGLSMIRTFVFDLGNVILNFSHERMCEQLAHCCECTRTDVSQRLMDSGVFWKFERGELSSTAFHAEVQRLFHAEITSRQLNQAVGDIFTPNTELMSVIERLHQQKFRLVLLSNTNPLHYRFVRRKYPVLDLFGGYVLSYEVGAMKPAPMIFERLLDQIHCAPWDAFYTDDILEYVIAARGFGLQAEPFVDTTTYLATLRQLGVNP